MAPDSGPVAIPGLLVLGAAMSVGAGHIRRGRTDDGFIPAPAPRGAVGGGEGDVRVPDVTPPPLR